jgi:Tol biopolymer transport system component
MNRPFRFFRTITRFMAGMLILLNGLIAVGITTSYGLPDRGALAFSVQIQPLKWHILWMDVRTRLAIKVGEYDWRVAVTLDWSLDGKRLTYATYSPRSDIFVADVYDRQVHNLTDDWAEDRYPVWSPDGRHIAFYSNRDRLPNARFDIYVASITGDSFQRMTFDEAAYPVWSPDGTQLVYSARNEGDLYSVNTTCLEPGCSFIQNRLTATRYDDRNPMWSPDGEHIAFITFLKGPGITGDQIHVINRDGDGLRLLASGWRFQGVPSWSPDGHYIAFVGKTSHEHLDTLYVVDMLGSTPPRKLVDDAYYAYNERWPMWSPDSRYIAYSHRRTGGLYVVEVATGYVDKLSHLPASYPVWQPRN